MGRRPAEGYLAGGPAGCVDVLGPTGQATITLAFMWECSGSKKHAGVAEGRLRFRKNQAKNFGLTDQYLLSY